MSLPKVAVVGRPNVGKSTLVNRLAQNRDTIVHESRGVTRDRTYHTCDWNGRDFILIDTGGIESIHSSDDFAPHIREQALFACEEADVIVFVVDGQAGITEEDEEVARTLRRSSVPVILCANKMDHIKLEANLWEFLSLGLGDPLPISAEHGTGTGDLLDMIVERLPEDVEDETDIPDNSISIAIVGRPNVGKSSLLNKLVGSKRSIVSDIAGTTRDAIDVVLEHNGTTFTLVDTAGMRRKSLVTEDVEYYSYVRGLMAMDRADVCLLVIDASIGVTEQDQKVAGLATDRGSALVILLNKWDLMKDEMQREEIMASLARRMTFATWAPVLRISALTGRSIDKVLDAAKAAAEAHACHISTARLNNMLAAMRESGHTIVSKGKRLKVNYVTQTGQCPPTFTFFCNAPELVDMNYRRYVENRLRESFDLVGTPIKLRFRSKE